jgi:hypothetical protein
MPRTPWLCDASFLIMPGHPDTRLARTPFYGLLHELAAVAAAEPRNLYPLS